MTPSQNLEFLGMMVNTNTLLISLPSDKVKQIQSEANRISNMTTLSACLLSQFLGKSNAATQAVPPAPLFYRYLQQDLQAALAWGNQDYETLLSLTQSAREELTWWQDQLPKWNGKALRQCQEQMVIRSDASLSGWGAVCKGGPHRGCLVSSRADHAHQLPGAPGSYVSGEDIHEECPPVLNPLAVGQCHSSGLHQQHGGHSVEPADRAGEGVMIMHGHSSRGPAHSGCLQHGGRCRVANPVGSLRLDALSTHLPGNLQNVWSSGSGSVCFQTYTSTTPLLQLETSPSVRSSGCLPTGLGATEGICQSTMVPDQQSLEPSPPTTSSTGVGSTGMEGSDLVPSSTGDVMGFSLSNHSSSGSNPEANRLSNGTSASTSRVAHLRQRFLGRGISEEASKLMLSSWRSKSAQSYDSHFRKWASWCAERGCDPISGPASEVANFLAELFHQGYQSRFLNAFRSAISSVHNQVDSVAVGQHPTICRLLKGAFHERPPLPRYTATWNVQTVLQYLEGMGPTPTLSLKFLTFKLVMLLALTRPSRSADLVSLQLDCRQFRPEGVVFLPATLAKQSAQEGKPLKEYFFPSFPHNSELCPVETLRRYETLTAALRPNTTSNLFIALVKPHKEVTSVCQLPAGCGKF